MTPPGNQCFGQNVALFEVSRFNTAMTMRYAQFHPDYTDVGLYFDRVAKTFGLAVAGNVSGNSRSLAETPVGSDPS